MAFQFHLPLQRSQQPEGPIQKVKGLLVAAGYGRSWPADVGGANLTAVSGTREFGGPGLGILNPMATLSVPDLGTAYTVVVVAKGGIAANNENWLSCDDAGSNRHWQFRLNSSSQVELIRFSSGGNTNSISFAIPDTTKPYVAVGRCRGTEVSAYGGNLRGAATTQGIATLSGTPSSHTASAGAFVGCRDAALDSPFTGTLYAYFILPYWISDALAQALVSNPWQLLPRDSITFPFDAAIGIAFDAASNSGDQGAASSYSGSASWSGSNRFLAVDVSMLGPGVTVSSMTYGGAACTFIGAISTVTSFGRVEQWRIASSDSGAPAAGSNTLAVTLSGSLEFTVEWASYTGVHQTSPTEAFNSAQATNSGSATDASVAVTSIADNCWIHAAVSANDTSITPGNTTRNNVSGTLGSGANEDNGAPKTPAGSVTMSYSGMGITTTWAIAGYAIRPVAASGLASIVPILLSQYRMRRA